MQNPLGDFAPSQTVTCRFNTEDASGAPATLAGTPVVQVRKGSGSGSVITAGITLAVDVVTGQHVVDVNLTGSVSYTAGADYAIELSAGTVGGVSAVGKVVGTFSIVNRLAGVALTSAAIQSIWDALTSALTTTGSIGKWILDKLDVVLSTRLAASGYTAPDNSSIAAIKSKTDNLPASPADESLVIAATNSIAARLGSPAGASVSADIAALPTAAANADKLLGRNIAGGSDGGRTMTSALRMVRNKVVFTPIDSTSGTFDVYAENDSDVAFSGTYVRAVADALQTVDPS